MAKETPELGLEQVRALTHPLRIAILRALRSHGPATATALGRRLNESSGSMSYHLRQLEKHGFVEEVPDSGDGRDRWWRPAFGGHKVEPARWVDDPEPRAIVGVYQQHVVANHHERAAAFVTQQSAGEWGREWVESADMSDFRLRLTPAQLMRLHQRMHALVESFGKYDSPGAVEVAVQIEAFPLRTRPFTEDEQ